jgi:predicted dehydrogenase
VERFGEDDPYAAELAEFARAIRERRDPVTGPTQILGNARAIEALLKSARADGGALELPATGHA